MVKNKSLSTAFLTAIILSGLILASAPRFGIVQASTGDSGIATPSVPEFTLTYVVHFYDVPPTYEIDEFTGEQVIKEEGYRVDNTSVVFKITNQPFVPYTDSDGNSIELYYNFRYKGSFGDDWKYRPFCESGISAQRYNLFMAPPHSCHGFVASTSEYTDLSFRLTTLFDYEGLEDGDQIDFQVQAQIGYISPFGDGYYSFTGQSSDWSETQTITVGESQASIPSATTTPTPTPSEEPQQTDELPLIIGVAIVAIVLGSALGLLSYLIKRK